LPNMLFVRRGWPTAWRVGNALCGSSGGIVLVLAYNTDAQVADASAASRVGTADAVGSDRC